MELVARVGALSRFQRALESGINLLHEESVRSGAECVVVLHLNRTNPGAAQSCAWLGRAETSLRNWGSSGSLSAFPTYTFY